MIGSNLTDIFVFQQGMEDLVAGLVILDVLKHVVLVFKFDKDFVTILNQLGLEPRIALEYSRNPNIVKLKIALVCN